MAHLIVFQLKGCPEDDKLKSVFLGIIPHRDQKENGVVDLTMYDEDHDYDSPPARRSMRDEAGSSSLYPDSVLVFINAFFRDNNSVSTTYKVVETVRYSHQPPGFLLIIQLINSLSHGQDSSTNSAYLIETGVAGQDGPRNLPVALDADGQLDLSLPALGGDLLDCLRRFMTQLQSLKCIICWGCFANIWFHSCGHIATCVTCSRLVDKCPTCHEPIPGDGRWLLPESFPTANFIRKDYMKPFIGKLQVVRNEPGWILREDQLRDIFQQSQPSRVLSTTARHVTTNLKEHGFTDQLQLEHLVDFMTDVMVDGVDEMHKIVQTTAYKGIIDRHKPKEYQIQPDDRDVRLVHERIRHHVRVDMSNRGYLIAILPAHKIFICKSDGARKMAIQRYKAVPRVLEKR